MISENLQKAIDGLRIVDVYVQKVLAESYGDFDPKRSSFDNLVLQTKTFRKKLRRDRRSPIRKTDSFASILKWGARWG